MKRLTKEEVNKRLEKYDVVLISEYTHQYDKAALLRCKCGESFNTCVKYAMTGNRIRCNACLPSAFESRNCNAQKIGRSALTNEQVQERLDQYGLTLLSNYTRNIHPIKVRCGCGEEYEVKYIYIAKGKKTTCLKCEYMTVQERFNSYGTQILTNQQDYMGVDSRVALRCFCGIDFQGRPCKHLNSLYRGSCGCVTRINKINLAGIKLNHFTILSNDLVRKNGLNYLQCQCDCGKVVLIAHHYIAAKRSKMCNTCSALNSTKGIRNRNAKELSDYLSQYGYTQLSPYRGTLRQVEVRCQCGKTLKMRGKYFLRLARQNARLNCKCNKIKNGRMTSNPVFKLHDILGRGVHNYNSKAGCIDIALCYKGKKVAIEYDEWWWHKDYKAKDDRKNKKLLDHGWFVLRLRVSGYLPKYKEMIRSLEKLIRLETRFLARTHKSWRGYTKED